MKYININESTLVDAHTVSAVQARFAPVDPNNGTITLYTSGGSVLVQSTDVKVDLERIMALLDEARSSRPLIFDASKVNLGKPE